MPYVIDKVTGKRRWASSDLLGQLLDTGAATLEEGQTIFMDDGDGEVIKIQSDQYEDVVKRGGRPITNKERKNLFENLRADKIYDQPSKRLASLGLGTLEGVTLGLSEAARGAELLSSPEEARRNEQDRKAREFFNTAESIAGNVLGTGLGLLNPFTPPGAEAAALAAKAATGASKMARATSMAQKAISATPAGLTGRAGQYVGDATAKALAKKIGAAGLAKNPKIAGAMVRAAPMVAQAATEDAIIGGVDAAAQFDSDVDPSDFASSVLAAAVGGGALGGGIGGALAFFPGARGFADVLGSKTLEGGYSLNKKLGSFAQKMTGELEGADAKTINKAFEGEKFTAQQIKKAVDNADIFSIQSPKKLAKALTRISTTGPREINDLFFDINNGTRKQAVDKIAKGTKGLRDLKKDFDADLFQKEYISYDGDFSDIIKNKKSYYADAIDKIEPPTDLGRALSNIRKSLVSTAVYNKVVDGIVDSVKASSKALRQNKFLSPITEMDPLDILRSEAGEELPSHLANNLILAHDKIRKSLYGLNLMGNRQVTDPIREYFSNSLENPRLFGKTSGAYKATNEVYTKYAGIKTKSNETTGREPISDQQARELFDKFLAGDKEAVDKVTAYQRLVKATQDYTDDVLKLTNQPEEAYESAILENIRAFNSLEGASQAVDLLNIYTPSKQNTFVKEVVQGVKDLRSPTLKRVGMPAAAAFLTSWALNPAAGVMGGLGTYAKITLGQAAAKSFRRPYRQLSRSARIEELNSRAQASYRKSIKKVISSIGKDGQFAGDALRVASKASRVMSANLVRMMGNDIDDAEYSNDKDKSLQEKAIASIETLASNPQLLDQKLEESIGEVEGSPQIKEALKQQSKDIILVLDQIRPPEIITRLDPLTGTKTISGPDYAFDRMNQFLAVAQSPLKVVSSAAESRTLTREMASAFKALHPQSYTNFVSSIQESLLGKKASNKTKYSDRLMLSTLFDIPMEASVTAPVMSALQSTYQESAQPEPRPQRGLASLKSQVTNTMTPSQRAMQTT